MGGKDGGREGEERREGGGGRGERERGGEGMKDVGRIELIM